ncbi:MAG: prepilin-type N-terminal cleavage/methylation domain-containing protein [Spirochaetes bacterium]|nr:prepilin-type N-terminal cleavage/methylation domain-containing protein [Spirochaetota bacterium]
MNFIQYLQTDNKGFTLIEILVATAVSSIILLLVYTTHHSIIQSVNSLSKTALFYEEVNLAIYKMNRDFSCAYFDRYKEKLFFIGTNEYGDKSLGKVDFVTINSVENAISGKISTSTPITDVFEVGYYLKQMEQPDKNGNYLYYLMRRSDVMYDEDPLNGGDSSAILANVVDCKFEFGIAQKFTNKWDSREYRRFPNAVKTTLIVKNPNGNDENFVFISYINLSR